MKVKTTKKEVLKTNQTVLQVGYCDLQNLLRLRNPYGYTCGADGWHADIYDYGTTAICTGYQPFGKKVPYDLCQKYDIIAAEYLRENNQPFCDQYEHLDGLIDDFIQEAKAL